MTPLGRRIAEARAALGWSLRECARQIEISPAYLSDLENGRRLPSIDVLTRLICVLCVPMAADDLWYADTGMLRPGMLDALLAHPERWGDVREVLAGDVLTESGLLRELHGVSRSYIELASRYLDLCAEASEVMVVGLAECERLRADLAEADARREHARQAYEELRSGWHSERRAAAGARAEVASLRAAVVEYLAAEDARDALMLATSDRSDAALAALLALVGDDR